MGEPFVQFFFDPAKGAAMKNSALYTKEPRHQPAELFMTVTCDSNGKVVVRKLWNKEPLVCGTALYRGGALVERQQNVPELAWDAIAGALRDELATAAAIPEAVRDASDSGVVGVVPAAKSMKKKGDPRYTTVAVWVVIAVLAIGVYFVGRWWDSIAGKFDSPDLANGEKCSRDTQCASRSCKQSQCRPNKASIDGARCVADAECASGNCSGNVCK